MRQKTLPNLRRVKILEDPRENPPPAKAFRDWRTSVFDGFSGASPGCGRVVRFCKIQIVGQETYLALSQHRIHFWVFCWFFPHLFPPSKTNMTGWKIHHFEDAFPFWKWGMLQCHRYFSNGVSSIGYIVWNNLISMFNVFVQKYPRWSLMDFLSYKLSVKENQGRSPKMWKQSYLLCSASVTCLF